MPPFGFNHRRFVVFFCTIVIVMNSLILRSVAKKTPVILRRNTQAATPHHTNHHRGKDTVDKPFRLFGTKPKEKVLDVEDASSRTDITEVSEDFLPASSGEEQNPIPPKRRKNGLRRMQQLAGDLFSAVGFVTSSTTALLFDRRQFQRLKPTVLALRQFLETSGIDLELSRSLNRRLLDNIVILGRIQGILLDGKDRRDGAIPNKRNLDIPTEEESLRYMRYATAAYGNSMIRAVEMGVAGMFDNRMERLTTRASVSQHIGVPAEDVVKLDVDYKGNGNHLRHFVAVDHVNRKVVLAIRGTFSLSEIVVDVAGFSIPFCGGEAHSEMASMARRVWEESGETVLTLLNENEGYELVLTGHSLGAGTACLLNVMCHQNGRELVGGRAVRCFAYASPPVFSPLEFASDAVRSCTNYIHHRDFVPFLSVDAVRHLFASVRVIDDKGLRWRERMKLLTGYIAPDSKLCQEVSQSLRKRLEPKKGAPILEIPASANLWMRRKDDDPHQYDLKICDSRKLAQLGIRVDVNMLNDHFPTRYEEALHALE